LLKDPAIVLLDEATSAVDSATEQLIQAAFGKLSQGRTTFVVAHRLSTIVGADRILVVDAGEIVEQGTHAELLAREGRYRELWMKQTTAPKGREAEEVRATDESADDGRG
jgi:ABC-type multidrug transport system fused ATPase/permease subunit